MIDHTHDQVIGQALQSSPMIGQPQPQPQPAQQPGVDLIRPVADAGDTRAQGLLCYWLMQLGQQPEATDWAERARDGGFLFICWWAGQQLVNQPDLGLRARGAALFTQGLVAPAGLDPIAIAQQLAQQGSPELGVEVLTGAVDLPSFVDEQSAAALEQVQQRMNAIAQLQSQLEQQRDQAVGAVETQRDSTVRQIAEMAEAADTELKSLRRLGKETGEIANEKAADFLQQGYGAEAKRVGRTASLLTFISVGLAIGIAIAAIVIGTHLPMKDTFHQALEKAAFSVPLLALNAYLGRLASTYRDEALRWRHIQLQIRTANPFLGALNEAQRKETLALLATRFFPGQPMPLPNKAAEPSDVSAALASMFGPTGDSTKVTVEPTP